MLASSALRDAQEMRLLIVQKIAERRHCVTLYYPLTAKFPLQRREERTKVTGYHDLDIRT